MLRANPVLLQFVFNVVFVKVFCLIIADYFRLLFMFLVDQFGFYRKSGL